MKPNLSKIEEFRNVLANYKISEGAKKLLAQTRLVLMVSPSSSGRNTIIKELEKSGKYEFIISHTTRPPRENNGVLEQNGVEYWFRSEDEMLEDLKKGEMLEAELIHQQQVSGISLRELKKATEHDKIAIDEVDYEGVANIVRAKPDTIAVMVLPPSPEEWMKRLRNRGDMTTDEISNRLATAEKILESVHERGFYKIVINDDLAKATERVRAIVERDEYSDEAHKAGQDLAWQLLSFVKQQLYS